MKTYATILTLTLSSIATSPLHADGTTIGIGVGINNGLKIYLPIKTDQLLIEPSIYLTDTDTNSTSDMYTSNNKYSSAQIGVGIFRYTNVREKTFIHYGARIGYIEYEQSSSSTATSPSPSLFTTTFASSTTRKQNGYFIAPTLGAEYSLSDTFSIGIDVSFNYSKTDGSENSIYDSSAQLNTNPTDIKSKNYNTEAEIVVRYYF